MFPWQCLREKARQRLRGRAVKARESQRPEDSQALCGRRGEDYGKWEDAEWDLVQEDPGAEGRTPGKRHLGYSYSDRLPGGSGALGPGKGGRWTLWDRILTGGE